MAMHTTVLCSFFSMNSLSLDVTAWYVYTEDNGCCLFVLCFDFVLFCFVSFCFVFVSLLLQLVLLSSLNTAFIPS